MSKKTKTLNVEGFDSVLDSLESFKVIPHVRGVYFLYNGDDLVYIGSSEVNVYKRIEEHKLNKEFTHFKILEIQSQMNLHDIEYSLIRHYMPKLNKEVWLEKIRNQDRLVDLISKRHSDEQ